MPSHPKILKAGTLASFLFDCACCWSAENRTNGFVPAEALYAVSPTLVRECKGFGVTLDELAQRCVAAGLFEVSVDGWWIHDFLEYHPTAEEAAAHAEHVSTERSKAGRIGGRRSAALRRQANEAKRQATEQAKRVANGQQGEQQTLNQNPSPIPIPELNLSPSSTTTSPEDLVDAKKTGEKPGENGSVVPSDAGSELQSLRDAEPAQVDESFAEATRYGPDRGVTNPPKPYRDAYVATVHAELGEAGWEFPPGGDIPLLAALSDAEVTANGAQQWLRRMVPLFLAAELRARAVQRRPPDFAPANFLAWFRAREDATHDDRPSAVVPTARASPAKASPHHAKHERHTAGVRQ